MTTEQNKSPPPLALLLAPLPYWIDDDGYIASGTGDDYQTIADGPSRPISEFIVRACNSHYDLLEALLIAENRLRHFDDASSMAAWAVVKDAIAKAQGQQ